MQDANRICSEIAQSGDELMACLSGLHLRHCIRGTAARDTRPGHDVERTRRDWERPYYRRCRFPRCPRQRTGGDGYRNRWRRTL